MKQISEKTQREVKKCLENSDIPKAMRLVMAELKCGLKEAKEIVDIYRR